MITPTLILAALVLLTAWDDAASSAAARPVRAETDDHAAGRRR